jgi:type I restriction enzyme S subunit
MTIVSKASAYPKSVQSGLPRLGACPPGWTRGPLSIHLIETLRPLNMADDEVYDLVTVKRSRGGVVLRERLKGSQIAVKSQFRLKAGDFLISKRQIVHGACGIVPPELDGAIVSNEYSVLRARPSLDLKFLNCLAHSIYFQQACFHSSIGVHVEKMIFKLDQWMKWDFNLPPLAEQKRIAEILATWDSAIEKVECLRTNSSAQKAALLRTLMTGKRRLPGFDEDWEPMSFGKLVSSIDAGVSVNSADRPAGEGESGILKTSCVSMGKFDASQNKAVVDGNEITRLKVVVKGGTTIISRMNTPALVGASGYVAEDVPSLYLPDRLWAILPDYKRSDGRWLASYLAAPETRQLLCDAASGTSGSMKNISKESLRSLPVLVPADRRNPVDQ